MKRSSRPSDQIYITVGYGSNIIMFSRNEGARKVIRSIGTLDRTVINGDGQVIDRVSKSTNVNDSPSAVPPLPKIDSTSLFWSMMSISRTPDPHMFPALLHLRSLDRFILGALSNTITFPSSHPYAQPPKDPKDDVRSQFDIFIGSADVGLRKPARGIYKLAIKRLDEFDKNKGGTGLMAQDIIFLDDIGENLKMAKSVGMRTIKVNLGQTERAVEQLGKEIGVELKRDPKARL